MPGFPWGHKPRFYMTESMRRKFCPICKHEVEWIYTQDKVGRTKKCPRCGIVVRLTEKEARQEK